jgi:hypothetical protein
MARNPNDVSVTFCPVRVVTTRAKTREPSRRAVLVVSFRPSHRDPVTKSAPPSRIGWIRKGSSDPSYWPSASVVAMIRAPPERARR